jgi:hypothetical protein
VSATVINPWKGVPPLNKSGVLHHISCWIFQKGMNGSSF